MGDPRIVEESVHRHYRVELPGQPGIWGVTWNRRRDGAGIAERWECTCRTPDCDHIRQVRAWRDARPAQPEQAA